ncbi:MAG: hypothetical protein R3F17_00720 [Planctomycetota bacterium]
MNCWTDRGIGGETDSEGEVLLPHVLNGLILAEGQGWTGLHTWVGPLPSPLELTLTPLKELTVQVRGTSGEIVSDVPVWVGASDRNVWQPFIQRGSNALGRVEFDGVSRLSNRQDADKGLAVYLAFPHFPRVQRDFQLQELPIAEVALKMPSTGSLEITVLGPDGEPLDRSCKVDIGMPQGPEQGAFQPLVTRRTENGVARFPYVGTATRVAVRVTGIPEYRELLTEIDGPRNAGEEAQRSVQWGQQRLVLVGMVVGPNGSALSNQRLRATWGMGKDRRSAPLVTEANGNFRVITQGVRATFLELESMADGTAGGPGRVSVQIANPDASGEFNLGILRLEGLGLFAEGFVFDKTGQPAAGIMVNLEHQAVGGGKHDGGEAAGSKDGNLRGGGGEGRGDGRGESEGGRGGKDRDGRGETLKPDDPRARSQYSWTPIPRMSAVTDRDGRFRIYGTTRSNPLRLTAVVRGLDSVSVEGVVEGGGPYTLRLTDVLPEKAAIDEIEEKGR